MHEVTFHDLHFDGVKFEDFNGLKSLRSQFDETSTVWISVNQCDVKSISAV